MKKSSYQIFTLQIKIQTKPKLTIKIEKRQKARRDGRAVFVLL
jgi:hypothetical protein